MTMQHYLLPTWPAPPTIRAYTTLRTGGCSQPPYDSFNLSTMVADNPETVRQNRQQLGQELNLGQQPVWIKQVHGTGVVYAGTLSEPFPEADAAWTDLPGVPCAVLTADCLPLLLCDPKGLQVAAIHAGWRGLAAGVIEATLAELSGPFADWLVWLGPAIGPAAFEVGEEVRTLFIQADPQAHLAFKPIAPHKYLGDMYLLARQRLLRYGITHIYGGEHCTWHETKRFYSYRRDGERTGRMASLIWITQQFPPLL
jgi:YfiH family protein